MRKILNIMVSINKDKLLHFFYGWCILLVLFPIIGKWSILTLVLISVGKELYDKKIDYIDILFTLLPAISYLLCKY